VERQRCAIEFCVRLEKSGSETLQLIHQFFGVGKHKESPSPKKILMNPSADKIMPASLSS
jgi:hypothetical protein